MVDHKNRDRLDNRAENLRLADDTQNALNQSKIRTSNGMAPSSPLLGACYDKRRGKWVSYIRANGKLRYLGTFLTDREAAEAYKAAAAVHHKEYAAQASITSTGASVTASEAST